jgi:hypothetical protein
MDLFTVRRWRPTDGTFLHMLDVHGDARRVRLAIDGGCVQAELNLGVERDLVLAAG